MYVISVVCHRIHNDRLSVVVLVIVVMNNAFGVFKKFSMQMSTASFSNISRYSFNIILLHAFKADIELKKF